MAGEVEDLRLLQRQIDMIMRIALRRGDDTVLAGKLHELLSQLCGGDGAVLGAGLSPQVGEALRIVREDPVSIKSIESLAVRLGTSRSNFDRRFAREVGQPPQKFLINCKMIEARRYLESSHLRIGEIADALGRCSAKHRSAQRVDDRQITPGCPARPMHLRREPAAAARLPGTRVAAHELRRAQHRPIRKITHPAAQNHGQWQLAFFFIQHPLCRRTVDQFPAMVQGEAPLPKIKLR